MPGCRPRRTAPLPGEFGKGARRTSTGGSSLTRALGLKVGRVVIDPGHGGHDQGTQGPHGLVEKELVLDVAQRLGKLIEERMNAEVIYTRSDDTFIPLEGRTAIANQKKADLFLSIHANSSPYPADRRRRDVLPEFHAIPRTRWMWRRAKTPARRNPSSNCRTSSRRSRCTKRWTSRANSPGACRPRCSRFVAQHPGAKNRGIKKAPFVVLIGANMPSVLAEIGFLSNPREESLLKKPDYRQKLAEALYRGISKYAEGLSHFQMAAQLKRHARAGLPPRSLRRPRTDRAGAAKRATSMWTTPICTKPAPRCRISPATTA